MKTMTKVSLLLSLAVCATSASASYFFNSQWGTMLNVGSAPNPRPDQLRAIGDSKYVNTAAKLRTEPAPRRLSASPMPAKALVVDANTTRSVETKTTVGQEKIVTTDLNRASLLRARAMASKAAAIKAAKAVGTKTGTAKTASTTDGPASPGHR